MRNTSAKISVEPAQDSSTVNLTCLLLLQSDGLEVAPGWGDCSCAVCQRHRLKVEDVGGVQTGYAGTTDA